MALTRKLLQGMGLTEEQVETIISEHTTVTGSMKDQIESLKNDLHDAQEKSSNADKIKRELDQLKEDIKKDDWQNKYTKEHDDFEAYKKDVASKETEAKKKSAYRKLLSDSNIGDKQIDLILKVTDLKDLKLKDDGTLEDADNIKQKIGEEWSGFVTKKETKPSGNPSTPPDGNGGGANSSRAKEIAKQYYEDRYGAIKGD